MRKYLILICVVGILSAGFHGLGINKLLPWNIVYSDVLGFFERVATPGFPYIDKLMEYPVLMGIFIQIMEIIGKTRVNYYVLSAVFLIIFAAATTYFLFQLIDEDKRKRILIYWVFAPSMFMFLIFNWDIIAILFTVLAFYFIQKDRNYLAAFFIALGFSSKFFPIMYLAPLLLKQKSGKEWIKIIAIFLITAILINGYFMLANFEGWSYFFVLNGARNSNPDNIWTLARFFINDFSVFQINTVSFLLFSSSFLWAMWRFRKAPAIILCFIGTIFFLFFNKVFSPQYILWLLPFFVILPLKIGKYFYALEFSNLAAFFAILPWFFTKNISYFYASIPFVLLRHLALLLILMSAVTLARTFDSIPKYSGRQK